MPEGFGGVNTLDGGFEGRRGEGARRHPAPAGAFSSRCLRYSGHRVSAGSGDGGGEWSRQKPCRRIGVGDGGVDFCEVQVFVYFGLSQANALTRRLSWQRWGVVLPLERAEVTC